MTIGVWIIFAALLAANALYVAAEFGAVGVRRSRVRRLSEDGNVFARRLLPYVEDAAALDRYVAASQIGITLSSLILGAYAHATATPALTPWIARHLAGPLGLDAEAITSAATVTVLIILTAVQVVLVELIPKSIALQFPTETALGTVMPMLGSVRIFRPVIFVLNGAATAVLRLFGGGPTTHRHLHSPQEISLLIAESRDGGLLEPDEHKRLQRALQLSLRTASDLMVPRGRLTMLNADTPWTDVIRVVAASPFSRLPVYRGTPDQIFGIVRVKDLVRRFLTDAATPLDRLDPLIRPVPRIPADLPADRIIGALRAKRAHLAIVVDKDAPEHVVGMVTIHDVVGALL
ncbi:MAG: HlyC/CorC family transporter [Acidobacteria bacterium]|nr:MAG: HlyC/CorC family transporter [Acidobacteriota bacterium]